MKYKQGDLILFNNRTATDDIIKVVGTVINDEDIDVHYLDVAHVAEIGHNKSIFGVFTSNPLDVDKGNIISILGNIKDIAYDQHPEYRI